MLTLVLAYEWSQVLRSRAERSSARWPRPTRLWSATSGPVPTLAPEGAWSFTGSRLRTTGCRHESNGMADTVIEHVLRRLNEIGVGDVFGVAGDYAFPVNDAIVGHPAINWIGCCNELNAAYAADGHARMRGVGAVCTTYGVGELAAMSAIAGSYAEHLAVFHLVGTPNLPTQEGRALVHHTLGNGEFDLFSRMAEAVVCASAIVTPHNAASETERLIAAALYHRRPVHMAFPSDVADTPVLAAAPSVSLPTSDPA